MIAMPISFAQFKQAAIPYAADLTDTAKRDHGLITMSESGNARYKAFQNPPRRGSAYFERTSRGNRYTFGNE